MKRIILIISVFTCMITAAFSQSDAMRLANDLYAKGNFTDAAKQYEEILLTEGVAPELYYNLGNAYFKTNEIGRSILNYERALRLSPGFEDARFNLQMAQQKVVDNIIQAPTFFLGRWVNNLIKLLTSNQWVYISFALFILFLIFLFLFIFGPSREFRKNSFFSGGILLVMSLVVLIFAGVRKDHATSHSEAVVMTGVVTVKSAPDQSGTNLFQLHEGTKVKIKSTLGSWSEIELGNGSVGWVDEQAIEKI